MTLYYRSDPENSKLLAGLNNPEALVISCPSLSDLTPLAGLTSLKLLNLTTTFFDDVNHVGSVQTSEGSITIYLGNHNGADPHTGTVIMEGDLKPGSSPAVISFGGDLHFGPMASLEFELCGRSPSASTMRLVFKESRRSAVRLTCC